jgi:predicted nucleotidyltransferase component of viral defense system
LITREELDKHAASLAISLHNVERDYVFGWLLGGVYSATGLAEVVTLKGGNALRKAYLPASRFSDDLDFSCPSALDAEDVLAAFNNACRYAQARSGVQFDLDRNRIVDYHEIERSRAVHKLALYFQDFSGTPRPVDIKVRVDVTEFDRLQLEPQRRNLIHQYSDAAECSVPIRAVALEEALADKLRCLLQRRYAFDLFDVVYGAFVEHDLAVDRTALMRAFLSKTVFRPNPAAAKQLLLTAPWEALRAFWTKIVAPASSRIGFDDALAALRTGLDELFAGLTGAPRTLGAYFPEPIRTQLFHAGEHLLLLRANYQRHVRLLEPYALRWMRRQDGVAREYLWVYDRTGGSRGPGFKSLVADQMASLEVLQDTFAPRIPVELAGGKVTVGSFIRSTGVSRARRPSSRSGIRRRTYVVQCPYCQRHFARTTADMSLREHKDGYGNRCYGRRGYRIN